MMKRLLFLILSCFCFISPVWANIKIDESVVRQIVPLHFKTQKAQASVVATLVEAAKAGNGTISATDLWKVCKAGGLDIDKKTTDKQKCEEFAYQLIKALGVDYKEVCGQDAGKSGGTETCERDLFKDIRVNISPAVGIAQEYVRVKHDDNSLRCAQKYRTEKRDDYLKCASANVNSFYEFRFDTLNAFADNKIKGGIQKAICKIHNTKYECVDDKSRLVNEGDNVYYEQNCGCVTDKKDLCIEIDKTSQKFGYSAELKNKVCEIDASSITNPDELTNDFADNGVDSFYFCSNAIQVTNNISFNDAIKEYLSFEVGVPESQIVCDNGFKSYTGKGCRTKWTNYRDDVVSCHIGDKKVDLVFDDINEMAKKRRAGGFEGVVCLSQGGVFDATRCETFDEEHCNLLKQKLATTCTDHCEEEVRWDDTYKACILPNAQATAKRDKIYNYALDAGIVLGAVALTVATGGTAAPGVWVVVAHVGTGMMIAGAVAKETAQAKMTWGIYEPFIEKANKCFANPKDVECAEKILKEDLQTLISYGDHFLKEEAHALDGIFAKLIERIPRDSQFWQEFINDESLWDCTDTGCTLKTKHQTWEYVSQAGDALMLVGGLMHIVSAIGTYKQTLNALNKVGGREVMLKSGMGKNKNLTQLVEPIVQQPSGKMMYPIVSNADLYNAGLTTINGAGANADVVKNLLAAGVKVGDRITIAQAQKLLGVAVATTTVKTTSIMLPLLGTAIAIMPGHGGEEGEFYIALVDENTPNGNNDGGGETIVPDDTDETVDTDIVSNDTTEEVGDDNNDSGGTGSGTNSNSNTFGNIQNSLTSQWFKPNKSKNTGVLAAAAVLGTVAAGGLIGGLVVASDKKDIKARKDDIKIDSDLENLMQKTQGSFGSVANNPLRLKTLPTVVNSNAPIVLINGKPVVVVLYKSYKLPFYMHGTSWAPLLGIGGNNYFNVYPTSENLQNNTKMTAIINALNASFNPAIVARYSSQVSGAVSFPTAATGALPIINSEFTNGVVQSQNMSDADRRLYNDNYKKIQQILK